MFEGYCLWDQHAGDKVARTFGVHPMTFYRTIFYGYGSGVMRWLTVPILLELHELVASPEHADTLLPTENRDVRALDELWSFVQSKERALALVGALPMHLPDRRLNAGGRCEQSAIDLPCGCWGRATRRDVRRPYRVALPTCTYRCCAKAGGPDLPRRALVGLRGVMEP